MERLLRVEAPHFVAGIVFRKRGDNKFDWFASEAAPILAWAVGWRATRFHEYLLQKNWRWAWL